VKEIWNSLSLNDMTLELQLATDVSSSIRIFNKDACLDQISVPNGVAFDIVRPGCIDVNARLIGRSYNGAL